MRSVNDNHVVIVDLGIGNLFSIETACRVAGINARVTNNTGDIETAAGLILPGVGAYANAMHTINELKLAPVLNAFRDSHRPMLGICLGMQLFMDSSEEFGSHKGLGYIPGHVQSLADKVEARLPHIGWSPVFKEGCPAVWQETLLQDLAEFDHQYFVHSFYVRPEDAEHVMAWTDYGSFRFASVVQKDNVTGCQFHPERSGTAGLGIYRRWGLVNNLLRQDDSCPDFYNDNSLPWAV